MKVEIDVPVRFSVKVTKVDKDKREVEGIATQEVLDHHNQIVDYESVKALVKDWPGNIREMHQPKAVGRAVMVEADDASRSIIVRSRVSKGAPDTWEKVLDGTLQAYSIGGTGKVVTEKNATGKDVARVFLQKWAETSLVDNPACPGTTFEICKSIDGELVGVQPAEPETDAPKVAVIGNGKSALIAKLAGISTSSQLLGLDVTKRAEPYDVQQALQCMAFLESLVANEMFEAEWATVVGEANADQQKAEIAYLRAAANFLLKFLVSEFEAQFAGMDGAAADVAMAKRRETVTAALEEFQKALPATWAQLDGTGQMWLSKAGARHSKKDVEMIQAMHDTSLELGAACKKDASEEDTAKAAQLAAAAAGKIANAAAPGGETPAPAAETKVEKTETPAVASETTAAVVETPAATPAAATTTEDPIVALTKRMEAQEAAHTGVVAELQKRIKDLEDQPMPGGPKTRATGDEPKGTPAEKRFGQDASAGADVDVPTVIKALTLLIEKEPDQDKRTLLAERLIAFERANGVGMLKVEPTTGRPQPLS